MREYGVWTHPKCGVPSQQAWDFWSRVFQWDTPNRDPGRAEAVEEMLCCLVFDEETLYFERNFWLNNRERCERFFSGLCRRINQRRQRWQWVEANHCHDGGPVKGLRWN